MSRQVGAWVLGSAVYAICLSIFLFTGIFGLGDGAGPAGVAWAFVPLLIFLVLYRNGRTRKTVEPLTRWPDGSVNGWSLLAVLAFLLFFPMVASADDAISAFVLQAEGREVTAEVVSVESDKRHGNPYQLQRSDGSPIEGEFSGPGQPTWPPGYRLNVVESPSGLVDPRVPEALNPVRPLSIFGISLGAQGAIYALFIVGYRRSKPQAPHHPITVQEIRMRVRSEAIRDVAFSRARDGGRGYDEREVDTFVDLSRQNSRGYKTHQRSAAMGSS